MTRPGQVAGIVSVRGAWVAMKGGRKISAPTLDAAVRALALIKARVMVMHWTEAGRPRGDAPWELLLIAVSLIVWAAVTVIYP